MLKKTCKILSIFAKEPWKRFTFKDIKNLSESKSESYVYNALKQFVRENILHQEKIGNVLAYSVNHSSKAAANLAAASEYEAWHKKHIPYKDMENIIFKIPANFFTFMVTGSYAKGKQTKGSDIDVVILCSIEPKKIYAELKHICEMNIPQIHLYVFTETEFLNMLLDKKPNYGKETAKNNLILSGAEAYYRIVLEAIKNGFIG
jgi:predicted nucleotidyltransferase